MIPERIFTSVVHWCILTNKEDKSMATSRARYTVSLDDEMFEKVEDFRFEHRFQTRSEATVELIRLGLEAVGKKKEEERKDG